MLYRILKFIVSVVLKFYIKDFRLIGKSKVPEDRAVLFAAFHSNSFLDAIILDVVADRPVWSLARGDAFKSKWVKKTLHRLYMLPIFRASEGRRNLSRNEDTFEKCSAIFRQKGQVLIFSEGLCKNQTSLLPLKKGTARLALKSWESGQDLMVMPVAINYYQFGKPGQSVIMEFGDPIEADDFDNPEATGANVNLFNQLLKERLETLITRDFNTVYKPNPLYYPGRIIHAPLNFLISVFTKRITRGTVFYDSVFVGLLILTLPLYWLLLVFVFLKL